MVNAEKWGAKIKKLGRANLLLPNFYVLPALSSQLSVFSNCVSWTSFCIFSCYFSYAMP